jgi:hypothetical protein
MGACPWYGAFERPKFKHLTENKEINNAGEVGTKKARMRERRYKCMKG